MIVDGRGSIDGPAALLSGEDCALLMSVIRKYSLTPRLKAFGLGPALDAIRRTEGHWVSSADLGTLSAPTPEPPTPSTYVSASTAATILHLGVRAVTKRCTLGQFAGAEQDEYGRWRIPRAALKGQA